MPARSDRKNLLRARKPQHSRPQKTNAKRTQKASAPPRQTKPRRGRALYGESATEVTKPRQAPPPPKADDSKTPPQTQTEAHAERRASCRTRDTRCPRRISKDSRSQQRRETNRASQSQKTPISMSDTCTKAPRNATARHPSFQNHHIIPYLPQSFYHIKPHLSSFFAQIKKSIAFAFFLFIAEKSNFFVISLQLPYFMV